MASMSMPELKIAAGLAVLATSISQPDALILAPLLASRLWLLLGESSSMQTLDVGALARAEDFTAMASDAGSRKEPKSVGYE